MSADFLQLYIQLGVSADCNVEDFKHACRRRIGDIHPDRSETAVVDKRLQMPLDELLALYASAIQFHQKHGRLPGASPAAGARTPAPARARALQTADGNVTTRAPTQATAGGAVVPASARAARDSAPTSHRYPMLILLGSFLLLTAIAWSNAEREEPVADVGEVASVGSMPADGAQMLEMGMGHVAVVEIQGEPLRVDGSRWEYGPSWLRFEDKRLVDWYSSPLHPLKTARPHPH